MKSATARQLQLGCSAVVKHEDSVRRVVQCACGASQRFRGEERLWAEGWGSRWQDAGRVWECPACWSPPKAPAEVPIYRVDPAMLAIAEHVSEARRRLERQMVRLLDIDPLRGEAFLKAIVAHLVGRSGDGAARWRALLEMVPLIPAEGQRRRKRRRVAPAFEAPALRRVAGERTEVFAIRLVPSERTALEAAATARGVRACDLVRSWCVAAGGGVLVPVASPPPPTPEPDLSGARRAATKKVTFAGWLPEALDVLVERRTISKGLRAEILSEPPLHPSQRAHEAIDELVANLDILGLEALVTRLDDALEVVRRRRVPTAPLRLVPVPPVELDPEIREEVGGRLLAYLEEGAATEREMLDDTAGTSDQEERDRVQAVLEELVRAGRVSREKGECWLPPVEPGESEGLPRAEPPPPCPLVWADVARLAAAHGIKGLHSGANSPQNVWGCVKRLRATPEQTSTREALYATSTQSGTTNVDLAIAWLVDAGEMATLSGKRGSKKEVLSLHLSPCKDARGRVMTKTHAARRTAALLRE